MVFGINSGKAARLSGKGIRGKSDFPEEPSPEGKSDFAVKREKVVMLGHTLPLLLSGH